MTRKRAADLATIIRRENVKRHADNAARIKLRNDQLRHQRVATMQAELDRLHASAIHGNALDAVRINRIADLRKFIDNR